MAFPRRDFRRLRIPPIQRRRASGWRKTGSRIRKTSPANCTAKLTVAQRSALRRQDRFAHATPPRTRRRRNQAAQSAARRFRDRRIRRRVQPLAGANARASRLPRTARSLDDAHQQSATRASGRRQAATSTNSTSPRSEEHTSELQSRSDLVCRLLLEKKKKKRKQTKGKKKKRNRHKKQ